jgi:hypothetical protein
MKDLLLLAFLFAAPGAGQAGDPADPAAAATTERSAAPREAGRRRPDERPPRDAKERRDAAATRDGRDAAPKDEKPCEPVKPCAID